MKNNSNKSEIITFLEKAKILISAGKYDFVPRRKNMQALAHYGMTITDVKNEIIDLVVSDYYKGPKPDLDPERTGDIWEFKKNIDGINFYVKVKIVTDGDSEVLRCIGFHEDDFA